MFVVMSVTFEVSGNWGFLFILLDCSLVFIHPFSKCPAGFSNIVFVAFRTGDQVYDIIKFTC